MRRILAFAAVLVIACTAAVGFSAAQLHKASEQVEFTGRIEYGDPAAAGDVQLTLRTQYDRHLFWNTACRFDNAGVQAQTEFSFSAVERIEGRDDSYSGVELQTAVYAGMGDPDEPQEGLAAAYQELYRQTPPGGERSRVIYLKDYCTYYPLSVHLDFPGCFLHLDPVDTYRSDLLRKVAQAFADFFRIPVLSDSQIEISVSRDISRNSTGFGMGKCEGDEFYLWTDSVCTDSACYFTFDAHTAQGKLADTSAIPGGYGIYRIAAAEDDAGMLAAVQKMEMAYALDPENTFLGLDLAPQQDALLVHTVEDGMYTLTVIEVDGMQTLQKLTVMPWPENEENYGWQFYISEEFIAVVLSEKTLTVLSRDIEGTYHVGFTAPLGLAADAIRDSKSRNAMDFSGENIVVSGFLYEEEMYGESCGFYLAVYDAYGLRYYGEYASSLDAFGSVLRYSERCFPSETDAICVTIMP